MIQQVFLMESWFWNQTMSWLYQEVILLILNLPEVFWKHLSKEREIK
jgi:hypothetical protein